MKPGKQLFYVYNSIIKKGMVYSWSITQTAQNIAEHVSNISNISLRLKYCRNIFVTYRKIFDRNITILTFWNIFENKYLILLEIL